MVSSELICCGSLLTLAITFHTLDVVMGGGRDWALFSAFLGKLKFRKPLVPFRCEDETGLPTKLFQLHRIGTTCLTGEGQFGVDVYAGVHLFNLGEYLTT